MVDAWPMVDPINLRVKMIVYEGVGKILIFCVHFST